MSRKKGHVRPRPPPRTPPVPHPPAGWSRSLLPNSRPDLVLHARSLCCGFTNWDDNEYTFYAYQQLQQLRSFRRKYCLLFLVPTGRGGIRFDLCEGQLPPAFHALHDARLRAEPRRARDHPAGEPGSISCCQCHSSPVQYDPRFFLHLPDRAIFFQAAKPGKKGRARFKSQRHCGRRRRLSPLRRPSAPCGVGRLGIRTQGCPVRLLVPPVGHRLSQVCPSRKNRMVRRVVPAVPPVAPFQGTGGFPCRGYHPRGSGCREKLKLEKSASGKNSLLPGRTRYSDSLPSRPRPRGTRSRTSRVP